MSLTISVSRAVSCDRRSRAEDHRKFDAVLLHEGLAFESGKSRHLYVENKTARHRRPIPGEKTFGIVKNDGFPAFEI